jgi:hypothetical protein
VWAAVGQSLGTWTAAGDEAQGRKLGRPLRAHAAATAGNQWRKEEVVQLGELLETSFFAVRQSAGTPGCRPERYWARSNPMQSRNDKRAKW